MKRTADVEMVEAHKRTLKIRALDCTEWLDKGHRPVSSGCGYLRCIDCNATGHADGTPAQCKGMES